MLPFFIATGDLGLRPRVEHLESVLSRTVDLLYLVLGRLDSKLGQELLGVDMKRLGEEAQEDVARIVIRDKRQPSAARLLRELTGVTWDVAHQVLGRWYSLPLEEKQRWLRLIR